MAAYGRPALRDLFDDSPTPHIAHSPRTHHRDFYLATDGSFRESGGGLGAVIETRDGQRVGRDHAPAPLRADVPDGPLAEIDAVVVEERDDRWMEEDLDARRPVPLALADGTLLPCEDRVLTTPHIGAATQEAQPRIASHMATSTRLLNEAGTVRDTVFAQGQTIGVNADPPYWMLAVVHSDVRGTKKAIDDSIYEAGASNLQSNHRDFPALGIAYDVNAIDQPLTDDQLNDLVETARSLSGDDHAIRALRQFKVTDTV